MKKQSEQMKDNLKTGERLKKKMNCSFYSKIVDSVVEGINAKKKNLITIKNHN